MLHAGQLPLHRAVPVVLDGVVGAAFEVFRDVGPPILQLPVLQEEDPRASIFVFIPKTNFFFNTRPTTGTEGVAKDVRWAEISKKEFFMKSSNDKYEESKKRNADNTQEGN